MAGPGVAPASEADATIEDLMPTILWSLDVPVPAGVDGSPLFDLLMEGAEGARPVGRSEEAEAAGVAPALTPEEEEALKESLRGLGYL